MDQVAIDKKSAMAEMEKWRHPFPYGDYDQGNILSEDDDSDVGDDIMNQPLENDDGMIIEEDFAVKERVNHIKFIETLIIDFSDINDGTQSVCSDDHFFNMDHADVA